MRAQARRETTLHPLGHVSAVTPDQGAQGSHSITLNTHPRRMRIRRGGERGGKKTRGKKTLRGKKRIQAQRKRNEGIIPIWSKAQLALIFLMARRRMR